LKIKLIVIGKNKEEYVKSGIDLYLNKLKHYIDFELKLIPDLKIRNSIDENQIKSEEAKQILKETNQNDFIILLDENGKELNSINFSINIQKKLNAGIKSLVFIIGGSYGFDPSLKSVAKELISLSKLTFNHQLVRLIFLEQLYRSFTIIKNEKYHHS